MSGHQNIVERNVTWIWIAYTLGTLAVAFFTNDIYVSYFSGVGTICAILTWREERAATTPTEKES